MSVSVCISEIEDRTARKVLEKALGKKECKRILKEITKEEALEKKRVPVTGPNIKYIDFKPPLTIACFDDGTKTIVKTLEEDIFDPEKGAALAIAKKYLGDKYKSNDVIKYYVDRYNEKCVDTRISSASEKEASIIDMIRKCGKETEDFIFNTLIEIYRDKEK